MEEHLLEANGGSLPDQIYSRMVEAILRGDFGDSGKLPTESGLASHFGVSRPTVREALSRLRSDGIIESRRGAGSHVVRSPGAPASNMPPIKNYSDIERYYAYRTCVESGAASAAAEARDAENLSEIKARFDAQFLAMESGQKGIEEDIQFHLAIARASHNQFFVAAVETSIAPIRQFMELARSVHSRMTMQRVRLVQMEHQAIVDAITQRSPADAAEAIRIHILNAKRRIFDAATLP
jgi:GntR family transcriptional regulator, transcriptional repressor for pyruvate dehydrogenase complex